MAWAGNDDSWRDSLLDLPQKEVSQGVRKASGTGSDNDAGKSNGQSKRRCVSTACVACRKRKSKTPSCAACASVYGTACVYDPNSDHRRKGVYKSTGDAFKAKDVSLRSLFATLLAASESEVPSLVQQMRSSDNLDDLADSLARRSRSIISEEVEPELVDNLEPSNVQPQFEMELSGQMGKMTLDNGSVSIIGGTSNLIFLGDDLSPRLSEQPAPALVDVSPLTSWSSVTSDPQLLMHLLQLYFTWHYTYFTTLSRTLFWRDFRLGKAALNARPGTQHCSELLVNAMLALGCHFTTWMAARADPGDSATAGDHFFAEAKRLMLDNDEHEKPALTTVQALALMSVREAGCGREARGWVYSGMSFRMACDLGLHVDAMGDADASELDARRITIWGCFLFDKCWSNYLGRQPQLPPSSISAPKFDVFPSEDAELWRPYLDEGASEAHSQPSRTRAVALQISELCAISSDLITNFYHPSRAQQPVNKQLELDRLGDLHTRLEAWRKQLPKELDAREGQLPNVLVMHMFYNLLFIHLFRPFLKYNKSNSPLPAHVSPRKFITHSATSISKLLRLYKRTYGFRQVCNIVVYMAHTACTVHLLNLPDKNAARDIVHGLNHLEEIAECWRCARRTLTILSLVTKRWEVELPEAAIRVLDRNNARGENPKSPSSTSCSDLAEPLRASVEAWPNPHSSVSPPITFYDTRDNVYSQQPWPVNYEYPPSFPPKIERQAQQRPPIPCEKSPPMVFSGNGKGMPDQDWSLHDSNAFRGAWNLSADGQSRLGQSPTLAHFPPQGLPNYGALGVGLQLPQTPGIHLGMMDETLMSDGSEYVYGPGHPSGYDG